MSTSSPTAASPSTDHDEMIWIEGGEFTMGSDKHYREEGPTHKVAVDGFWIDKCQVTNQQFAKFVEETGYVTVAERAPDADMYPGAPPEKLVPGALVFKKTEGPVDLRDYTNWWHWMPGADWRHPYGPESDLAGLESHPVVHVAYEDVIAYATWNGKTLATEAEWEYAARGELDGAVFAWGDDDTQTTEPKANTWQGRFPWENTEIDGWEFTAPVGSFPANGYGLHDMIGNVWEWTDDWYIARFPDSSSPCCVSENPRGAPRDASFDPNQPDIDIPRKVLKGGSHLCAKNYCFRYRPAARQPQMIDTGMTNLGFRCILREKV